jgi:hypothetical protein
MIRAGHDTTELRFRASRLGAIELVLRGRDTPEPCCIGTPQMRVVEPRPGFIAMHVSTPAKWVGFGPLHLKFVNVVDPVHVLTLEIFALRTQHKQLGCVQGGKIHVFFSAILVVRRKS